MSILWMDDASFYNMSAAQAGVRWDIFFNGSIYPANAGYGRFNTGAFFMNNSSATRSIPGGNITTVTVGLSFLFQGGGGIVCALYDIGSYQVYVQVSGNHLQAVNGNGTTLATSTNTLSLNVWYRLELKVTIGSSGTLEARINGSSTGWIPSATYNTQNTANAYCNRFGIAWGGSGGPCYYNDIIVTDTNSPNANFLGDKRCYLLLPNGDSSVSWAQNFATWTASHQYFISNTIIDSNGNVQRVTNATGGGTGPGSSGAYGNSGSGSHPTWATTGGSTTVDNQLTWTCLGSGSNPGAHNWMAVSEYQTALQGGSGFAGADDDISYNSSATPTQTDLFTVNALPSGATNIVAVDVINRVRKDDAGGRSTAPVLKSGATQVTGTTYTLSSSYTYDDMIQQTDPNTGVAWTPTGVNAMLVGYEEIT